MVVEKHACFLVFFMVFLSARLPAVLLDLVPRGKYIISHAAVYVVPRYTTTARYTMVYDTLYYYLR